LHFDACNHRARRTDAGRSVHVWSARMKRTHGIGVRSGRFSMPVIGRSPRELSTTHHRDRL
jgi:hypothetical protein